MHDGHNCFEPAASYEGTDWQLDEVIAGLESAGRITAPIVVAPYTDEHRMEEYWIGPTGEAYRRWLIEDLKPFVDASYATRSGREATAVMGSSMGGLSSFLFAFSHPEVFSMVGCLSPAFGTTLGLTRRVADSEWPTQPTTLYLDNGGDALDTELQLAIDDMLGALDACGFGQRGSLEWFRDEGALHHESAWSQRVWRPLELFFGPG